MPDDAPRPHAADRLAAEDDALGPRRDEAAERLQEGRLAGAVRADDRHRLALLDGEIDAEERLEVAVEGREAVGLDEAHSTLIPM